jgi:hypothetical protein
VWGSRPYKKLGRWRKALARGTDWLRRRAQRLTRWYHSPITISKKLILALTLSVVVGVIGIAWSGGYASVKALLSEPPQPAAVLIISAIVSTVISLIGIWFNRADGRKARSREILYRILIQLADTRKDVEAILQLGSTKQYSRWDKEDRDLARRICGRFNLIAWLENTKMMEIDVLAKVWFYSIPKCYDVLIPFLQDVRSERGPDYWIFIDKLVLKVIKLRKYHSFREGFSEEELERELAAWKEAEKKQKDEYRARRARIQASSSDSSEKSESEEATA